MIKTTDLYNSINAVLVVLYPSRIVYTPERQPKDFKRPSFLIEHIKSSRIDINRTTVQKTDYFTITAFESVDKYNRADVLKLIDIQDTLLNGFGVGYVTVGDRAIKVKSSSGGTDTDAVYIDLQFEYFDDRFEPPKTETEELIQSVTTTIKGV